MNIIFTDTQIEDLRLLLEKEYQESFSPEQAREIANNALAYYNIISSLDDGSDLPELADRSHSRTV